MMKNRLISGLLIAALAAFVQAQGKHAGETKQLDVGIEFHSSYGKTVVDARGTHYYIGSFVLYENKIYDSSLWGEYPLYFFNSTVGVRLTVVNRGPRAKAKIRLTAESNYLRTDGTPGASMAPVQIMEVEVARGETKTLDASFRVPWTPQAESGLDLFTVKVSHPNEGENAQAGLIMVKKAIFCPPSIEDQAKAAQP